MNFMEYSLYDAELLRSKGLIVTEDADLGLAIVRYHKSDNHWKNETFGHCNRDDPFVVKHRSVVYSLASKCVIHASPPRRKDDGSVFLNSLKDDNWYMTPYIDGTMISAFWNHTTGEWVLSTRSKFHATCKFMSERLFRDLLNDAIPTDTIHEFLSRLDREFSYTFVLCHPENKHIVNVSEPKVYLVHAIKCTPHTTDSGDTVTLCTIVKTSQIERMAGDIGVDYPRKIDEPVADYCRRIISSEAPEGVMLTPSDCNSCYERIRIISNVYSKCVSLRGNTPSSHTNIIRLWSNDPTGSLMREYLQHFPEEDANVQRVMNLIFKSSEELSTLYKHRHVTKTIDHEHLPHWTRKAIWGIHGMYLRDRIPIQRERIFEYYRSQSPTVIHRMFKSWEKEFRQR